MGAPLKIPLARLREAFDEGLTYRQIAARFGCDPCTIQEYAKLLGKTAADRRGERQERVKAAFEQGLTREQTAKLIGCSTQTVKNDDRVLGIQRRWGNKPSFNHDEVRRLKENGASYTDIAKAVGCSIPAVWYAANPGKRS